MTYAKALSSYPSIKNQEYTAAIPNMNKIPALPRRNHNMKLMSRPVTPMTLLELSVNEIKQRNFS